MRFEPTLTIDPQRNSQIKKENQKVASFDVFDTLLTRKVGAPKAVFLLLGNYLWKENIIRFSPEVFARTRANAETVAHNKPDVSTVNLIQIYKELQHMLKLTPEASDYIRLLECNLESKLLTALPGAIENVNKALDSGKKIVLISDMYLPSSFIMEQIIMNGFSEVEKCYVSNEFFKSKRTGELFKIVANDYNLPSSHFTHFGDNKKSDLDAPIKLKWNAVHYTASKINKYEHILNSFMWETGGLSSAMAGASRLARLSIPYKNNKGKEIGNISTGVVAPTLVAYILWVLQRANEMGLKRLYFVARDGQIFLKIAKILNKKLKFNIEMRYLYGSRKAWQFPSITNLEEEIDWITKKVGKTSLRKILARVYLQPEEVKEVLEKNGFFEKAWDWDLYNYEIQNIKEIFLESEIGQIIFQKVDEKRRLLFDYFQQEGLTFDEDWALVDIGWGGNSQNYMGKILEHFDSPLPKGFYFALKSKEQGEFHGIKQGFLVDKIMNVGYSKVLKNIHSLIESFCTADHGSLKSYERRNGKIVPVLENNDYQKSVEWEILEIHDAVCTFTEEVFLDESYIDLNVNLRPMVACLIEEFARNPSKDESLAWGSFQFEENEFEIKFLPLAKPYRLKHLFKIFIKGDPYLHKLSWLEGSITISPKYIQKLVFLTAKTGNALRKHLGRSISSKNY